MPKKRKKNPKTPRKQAPARSASVQWPGPGPEPEGWKVRVTKSRDALDGLADRYPTPLDGVKAVRAGEHVEWIGSIEGSMMRHRIVFADDGTATVEQAVFVGGCLEQALLCAWHQAEEPGRDLFETGVLTALDDLHATLRPVLEAEVRDVRPDYHAAVLRSFREEPERNGAGMPVFGWRVLHPVSPETTWEDTIDAAAWNSSLTMSSWPDHYDHVPELQPARLAQLLRDHGVPAVLCAGCGTPITDRHPRWTGVWITPDSESGPVCRDPHADRDAPDPLLGTFTDQEFGDPHRPA
ncbi:hypothetical protein AB8O64_03425 [Streptomyces sp. QH1-20]|uniref:hypothetical protein n=1 Tax=Streptomyces sp. QH1-20 TaxID=3240934 RepID=UPI0035170B51